MKKKYPNLMMQSASSYDTTKVKENVDAQIQEERAQTSVPTNNNENTQVEPIIEQMPKTSVTANDTIVNSPVVNVVPVVSVTPTVAAKPAKPRLRQQAYYLTEQEIKTIKRLSYELDIPKSDLVRKFIDEGIAKIDHK